MIQTFFEGSPRGLINMLKDSSMECNVVFFSCFSRRFPDVVLRFPKHLSSFTKFLSVVINSCLNNLRFFQLFQWSMIILIRSEWFFCIISKIPELRIPELRIPELCYILLENLNNFQKVIKHPYSKKLYALTCENLMTRTCTYGITEEELVVLTVLVLD